MRSQHMMRAAAAGVAALLLAGPAAGQTWDPALDEPILINGGASFTPSTLLTFDAEIPPSDRLVTGFSFVGDCFINPVAQPANAAWLQMTITAPDGFSYVVGGVSDFDSPWDFSGPGVGGDSGTYRHGIGGDQWFGDGLPDFAFAEIPIGGTWRFGFLQQRYFGQWASWSNVTVTLHSIPESGTLALLLAAAVVGLRRRA